MEHQMSINKKDLIRGEELFQRVSEYKTQYLNSEDGYTKFKPDDFDSALDDLFEIAKQLRDDDQLVTSMNYLTLCHDCSSMRADIEQMYAISTAIAILCEKANLKEKAWNELEISLRVARTLCDQEGEINFLTDMAVVKAGEGLVFEARTYALAALAAIDAESIQSESIDIIEMNVEDRVFSRKKVVEILEKINSECSEIVTDKIENDFGGVIEPYFSNHKLVSSQLTSPMPLAGKVFEDNELDELSDFINSLAENTEWINFLGAIEHSDIYNLTNRDSFRDLNFGQLPVKYSFMPFGNGEVQVLLDTVIMTDISDDEDPWGWVGDFNEIERMTYGQVGFEKKSGEIHFTYTFLAVKPQGSLIAAIIYKYVSGLIFASKKANEDLDGAGLDVEGFDDAFHLHWN